jgi:hypothetical protein
MTEGREESIKKQSLKMKEDLIPVDSIGDGDSIETISGVDEKRLLRRIDMW